jgi:hypothetical protein
LQNDMNTSEIENILRAAPKPEPPRGLKERLAVGIQLPPRASFVSARPATGLAGWVRRWWPALAPAAVSLACAVVFAIQQAEIRELKQAIETLSQPSQPQAPPRTAPMLQQGPSNEPGTAEEQEIARLRELAGKLNAELAQLEQMRLENQKLQNELARPAGLSAEDAAALDQARERAMNIVCVNHLKQLGLALKVFALDNTNVFPEQVLDMTNEMGTPEILVCPADPGHHAATDWATCTMANCSYEYLAAGAPDEEPMRVVFRCPIHGNIGLADGSVQGGVAKSHPERLIQRAGKLYLQDGRPPAPGPRTVVIPAGSTPGDALDEFRRRYGLSPSNATPDKKDP